MSWVTTYTAISFMMMVGAILTPQIPFQNDVIINETIPRTPEEVGTDINRKETSQSDIQYPQDVIINKTIERTAENVGTVIGRNETTQSDIQYLQNFVYDNATNTSLICPTIVLKPCAFEIFDNGTLHVASHDLMLNRSSYIKKGKSAIICEPKRKEDGKFNNYKLHYISFLALFFYIPAPIFLCLRNNQRHYFFLCEILPFAYLFSAMFAYLLLPWDVLPDNSVIVLFWLSVPSFLNFSTFMSIGWLCALTSRFVLSGMRERRKMTISRGRIIINSGSGIVGFAFVTGLCLAAFTDVSLTMGIMSVFGLPAVYPFLALMPLYFFPAILACVMCVVWAQIMSLFFPLEDLTAEERKYIAEKNCCYFIVFLLTFLNWTFGCGVIISGMWIYWNLHFAIFVLIKFWLCWLLSECSVVYRNPARERMYLEAGNSSKTVTVNLTKFPEGRKMQAPVLKPTPEPQYCFF